MSEITPRPFGEFDDGWKTVSVDRGIDIGSQSRAEWIFLKYLDEDGHAADNSIGDCRRSEQRVELMDAVEELFEVGIVSGSGKHRLSWSCRMEDITAVAQTALVGAWEYLSYACFFAVGEFGLLAWVWG